MELGQRIRQARLDAGLSQRQLCEGLVTRNMLSQIENGSARPSMDTLRALASRLGKSAGYFLDEEQLVSPNQTAIEQARQATGLAQLRILEAYQSPDPVFDPERWLMEALTCLDLAKQAITDGKLPYARDLLERAKSAGEKTPYYTQDLQRRQLLLCYEAGMPAQALAVQLLSEDTALMLLAQAALDENDFLTAGRYLDATTEQLPRWHFMKAAVWEAQSDYDRAISHYLQAEQTDAVFRALERCYLEKGDYKQAYFYACKQR